MNLGQRISAFASLGDSISKILAAKENDELHASPASMKMHKLIQTIHYSNPWFIEEYVRMSLKAIKEMLTYDNISNWCLGYTDLMSSKDTNKKIAVVSAGNLPLVGFHDFLCVLMSGYSYYGKLSSKDDQLLKIIGEIIIEIDPEFSKAINFVEIKMNPFDAIIATGSNNSSRYFDYYFGKYPNLIRKNRNSIAILDGKETQEELDGLADDIFLYFGLGCRNISKLYVPSGYSFNRFFEAIERYNWLINHNKYMNNYDYSRVIFLVNVSKHLDNNFLLLKKEKALSSPIAVLYYDEYEDLSLLLNDIHSQQSELQCIVSHIKSVPGSIAFGSTQFPSLTDYADSIDTMKFLLELCRNNP
jgi:Acyl-CoA reductase (LuxC)